MDDKVSKIEESLKEAYDPVREGARLRRPAFRNDSRSDSGSASSLPKELTETLSAPGGKKAHDSVNHPLHYVSHPSGVECIIITEWMSFNLGNAVKYIWRANDKGATLQDLEKARWYLGREINRLERIRDSNT